MNCVLGCDIGTTNLAVARVLDDGSWYTDFLKFAPDLQSHILYDTIDEFFSPYVHHSEFKPEHLSIETVFHGLSSKTFARMKRVSFCLEVLAGRNEVESSSMSTSTWRSTLFGSAKIPKAEGQRMAQERWPELLEFPAKERGHRTDALCIAQATLERRGLKAA